jgi:hypothetical protein
MIRAKRVASAILLTVLGRMMAHVTPRSDPGKRTQFLRMRLLSSLGANLTVGLAGGIVVLRYERELRALSHTATWLIITALLVPAVLPAFAPQLQAFAYRAKSLWAQLASELSRIALSMAPLLFILATLLVVFITTAENKDLVEFLRPLGPVVAGCGGAMSLAAATASGRVARRRVLWGYILQQSTVALLLVLASALFNRFGFHAYSWALATMAIGAGEHDIHASVQLLIDMLADAYADNEERAVRQSVGKPAPHRRRRR